MKHLKEFWIAINFLGCVAALLGAAYMLHTHRDLNAVYNIVIALFLRLNLLEVDLKQAGPEMTEEQFKILMTMLLGKPKV